MAWRRGLYGAILGAHVHGAIERGYFDGGIFDALGQPVGDAADFALAGEKRQD